MTVPRFQDCVQAKIQDWQDPDIEDSLAEDIRAD